MIVMKFGGTSVGSPGNMKTVGELVERGTGQKIIVLSAFSGVTNSLVKLCKLINSEKKEEANQLIDELEVRFNGHIDELIGGNEFAQRAKEISTSYVEGLRKCTTNLVNHFVERSILAHGELVSTNVFHQYLLSKGKKVALLNALEFMRIDRDEAPDMYYIQKSLNTEMKTNQSAEIFITQGFICRDVFGEIANLKRGGSDYTASIIGAAIKADEVQIWTDISGMHNNDPRVVEHTKPIQNLSFDEAAELSYFGAKILHPSSIRPAKDAGIPVWLKNTMAPEDYGTLISSKSEASSIKAIAAKDGITAVKIKSGRMLMAYGFLRNVFEVFERYRTPIDMITTSEVAVSITIDDTNNLNEIKEDLESFGTVEIDKDQTIICIVGDFLSDKSGLATRIFDALKEVPLRMISYGGSKNNVSILIGSEHKIAALKGLNKGLFNL